ncbi:HET-domain-containing protein, partial [Cenococcum geophilum 1.58]|uniref:HET-domain-containing protein n=1 Tax=Cenococcum geophilum 1.58 TaxID=794803 RepID=UPI00358FC053
MADSRSTNDFGASSGSTQSYSLAKNWLRSCLDDHRPSTDDTQNFFPDRVLDLGRRGDTTVKLYLSPSTDGGQGRRERYATLSYCWGAANHLKLEGAVLQSFQAGINTSELPRTMRHAVGLVRELGLRFLWIDSLCIIQDSIDDWRTQSALMGSIYQHSHINIAASTSEDSEGGLFFSRVPQTVRPVQVTCHFPFGRPNILSRLLHRRNAQPRLYNVLQQKPYFESIEQATLNSRGWVMQERLLAPRTLHCTRNQLFWECEHMLANESHPDGIETTLNRQPGEFRRMLTQFSHDPTSKVDNGIQRAADVAWFSLVKEYSICNLTKEEDILIAISGLAKRWIQIIPDRYIAGFWKQSLQEGLLWHGEQMIPALVGGEPCSTWRAPSWSWAS